MNLRRKLFLSIGLLLLLLIGFTYFLSEAVLKRDLNQAQAAIESYVYTKESQQEEAKKIVVTFTELHEMLITKLTLQLLLVDLLFFAFALYVLWRFIKGVTQPITALARETEKIVKGQYDEIKLPKVTQEVGEIATLTNAFDTMVQGLKDKEKIRSVLNKVVSKDVAEEILRSNIQLGGEERVITILFSDIRNFTKMTEYLPPQETLVMLNAFMTKMTSVIEGEGGVIDKYVGDEIMALYGAPVSYPDHALRALSSAKIMIETLKQWNAERIETGQTPIEIGIGIHTGLVIAGNVGAEDRRNYTVLGASVNLAARLCQAAQGMQILVSEYTLKEPHIMESFEAKRLPPLNAKGFSDPVNIYEIVGFKWQ